MIEKAINKIVEMMRPEELWLNNRLYTTRPVHPVLAPTPKPLASVHTLNGLADYLNENIDKLDRTGLLIHVESPTVVKLYGNLDMDFRVRALYVQVEADCPPFRFEMGHSVEEFVIKLQAMFCCTDGQKQLLKIAGNLKSDFSTNIKDNGITQHVTVKTGITTVEEVAIENPVTLKPYRTFIEVDQPESTFIFRISKGKDGTPSLFLLEADGGAWKLEAIMRIREWIKEHVSDVALIA